MMQELIGMEHLTSDELRSVAARARSGRHRRERAHEILWRRDRADQDIVDRRLMEPGA